MQVGQVGQVGGLREPHGQRRSWRVVSGSGCHPNAPPAACVATTPIPLCLAAPQQCHHHHRHHHRFCHRLMVTGREALRAHPRQASRRARPLARRCLADRHASSQRASRGGQCTPWPSHAHRVQQPQRQAPAQDVVVTRLSQAPSRPCGTGEGRAEWCVAGLWYASRRSLACEATQRLGHETRDTVSHPGQCTHTHNIHSTHARVTYTTLAASHEAGQESRTSLLRQPWWTAARQSPTLGPPSALSVDATRTSTHHRVRAPD